jgi:hypothetical protein
MMRPDAVFSVTLLVAVAPWLPACGGALSRNDGGNPRDASIDGNPAQEDAGAVLEPDASIPGVSRNGWTWSNGGPQAADLYGVWGSGKGDVWFVGAAGTIVHWDGHAFSAPASGSGAGLRGVWGSGPSDVWAVGSDDLPSQAEILHWDGSAWSLAQTIPSADLHGVWGSGASDVWTVGAKGVVWHYDGVRWSEAPSGTMTDLSSVWCSGPGDAWAVGSAGPPYYAEPGFILRWNGSSWSPLALPDGGRGSFAHVWGTGPRDVWLAGDTLIDTPSPLADPNGYLVHWDGAAWGAPFVLPAYDTPLRAVYGSTPGDAKAVGSASAVESWTGSAWSAHALPGDYEALWESGADDAWAVGLGGVMAHFDGTDWTQLVSPPPALGLYTAAAIRSNGPTDAWVVGNGAIEADVRHWDGHSWTPSTIDASSSAYMYFFGLWGTGANDVWGVGSTDAVPGVARIVHYDGQSWSDAYDFLPTSTNSNVYSFRAVWGGAKDDVWFAGDSGALAHWDGTSVAEVSLADTDYFSALGGTSTNDVWLASTDDASMTNFRHYDGHAWAPPIVAGNYGPPTGLYAATPTDAWALGFDAVPMHWDGTTWSVVPAPASQALSNMSSIWGSGPHDIWAVGFGGVVHFDGSSWSAVPLTSDEVAGVSGSGPSDVWIVTDHGAILHHP